MTVFAPIAERAQSTLDEAGRAATGGQLGA